MSEELTGRIERLTEAIERRFDEAAAAIERQFGETAATMDRRFAEAATTMDRRFDETAAAIEQRFDAVNGRIDEVERYMHVLHEDVIGRLAALPELPVTTRSQLAQTAADVREELGRRLDPLEALGRDHEARIQRLEGGRR